MRLFQRKVSTKKVIKNLEELIKSTSIGATHGGTTEGDTDGTLTEKKGVKKGYVINIACLLEPGSVSSTPRGDKIEYINYYPRGEVEYFSIRIIMGGADIEMSELMYNLRNHVTIEAWMQMRDQEEPLYGAFNMDMITDFLESGTDNPHEKKFIRELGLNIAGIVNAKDKLYRKKFGP